MGNTKNKEECDASGQFPRQRIGRAVSLEQTAEVKGKENKIIPMENTTNKEERDASGGAKCQPEAYPMSCALPFISECEVICEGESSNGKWNSCEKNKGHVKFIPVSKFKKEDLPEHITVNNDDIEEKIKSWCDYVCKLTVKYTSKDRPDTYPNSEISYPGRIYRGSKFYSRCGTGHIIRTDLDDRNKCPCHKCRVSKDPHIGFLVVVVSTSIHVVFNDEEAKETVVELFYDDPNNRKEVKTIYGVRLGVNSGDEEFDIYTDSVWINCVTHDRELMEKLCSRPDGVFRCSMISSAVRGITGNESFGMIISHPHGYSKHITIGNFINVRRPLPIGYQESIPFKIGPDARFRFTENCPATVMESFQTFTRLPKEKDTLKEELTVKLPDKSKNYYIFQSKNRWFSWVTFPPGTELSLPGVEKPFIVSEDTIEFDVERIPLSYEPNQNVPMHLKFHRDIAYMTYDIDTCQGSSGAPAFFFAYNWAKTHCGVLDGFNASGLDI